MWGRLYRDLPLERGKGAIFPDHRVTATFPELPAAHAVQEARGEGSSLSVGIKRALGAILRERHVKGRRISTVKLFVRVEQREEEPDAHESRLTAIQD